MGAADAASDAGPPWPTDALEVGRIADAWGIKGWIKVQAFSSDPQALLGADQWFVSPPEDAARAGRPARLATASYPRFLDIVDARQHGDFVVALPRGSADRDSAEALRGARLFVSRSRFPASGKDEYYWADLIGLEVRNREGTILGTVAGLLDTGPQSVLRVRPPDAGAEPDGNERLIPFVAAYVDEVDVAGRRITVDWGLDY